MRIESMGFMRHSEKPNKKSSEEADQESSIYPGLSEKGVEKAKNEAKYWLDLLDKSPEGSILLLAPSSEQTRTKSTIRALSDEIKDNILNKKIDYLSLEDINKLGKGFTGKMDTLKEKIQQIPNTDKIVISAPLTLKGFTMKDERWLNKDGKFTEYANKLSKRNNHDQWACIGDWIKNKGRLLEENENGEKIEYRGADPTQVAKEHLKDIERLSNFAKKYIGNRPLIIGSVGHSWNLDVLAIYLKYGKVDYEGYKKIAKEGSMIKTMEPIVVLNGKLKYRGKEVELWNNKEF